MKSIGLLEQILWLFFLSLAFLSLFHFPLQKIISGTYHTLINLLFGLNFFDVNWIHMYRREQMYRWLGRSNGVFFLAETVIRAQRMDMRIVGVDVNYIDRVSGTATGIRPRTIARTFRDVAGAVVGGLPDVEWKRQRDKG